MAKLWGGRFEQSTDEFAEGFQSSIGFDSRMYREDIMGSIAHAKMPVSYTHLDVYKRQGDKVPKELAALLQANSRVQGLEFDLERPDYDVDVLIIGGGGAGDVYKRQIYL